MIICSKIDIMIKLFIDCGYFDNNNVQLYFTGDQTGAIQQVQLGIQLFSVKINKQHHPLPKG